MKKINNKELISVIKNGIQFIRVYKGNSLIFEKNE